MPTYEFRCPDGTIVERIFKISEAPQSIPSPNGDGIAVRIISGGADLIFKGSGFYITDYGKDGKKDQRESASKADPKSESAGSESKSSAAPKADAPKADAPKSDSPKSDSPSGGGDKKSGSGPGSPAPGAAA